MGYVVVVRKVSVRGSRHTYAYGREGRLGSNFTLDTTQSLISPSDAEGNPTSRASLSTAADVEERAELDDDEWTRFVEAAVGVLKRVRAGGEPPERADRIFG